MKVRLAFLFCLFAAVLAPAQTNEKVVTVDLSHQLGPMKIDRFSLGQGGFSADPMFTDRIPELRLLRPRVIRLFLQDYYDFLPKAGDYQFSKLDPSVDAILQTGAKPLLCMVFKPKVLFPRIDQDLTTPTSWSAWEDLVYHLVRHYRDRNGGGWYWEVGNEVDLTSGGGTPYHMSPQQYIAFYEHTVNAIRRADPDAHVGGPAQAYFDAPIIGALLAFCSHNHVPLDFVSWHGYRNDPKYFRHTIESFHEQLRHYPDLHPQSVIDEWNIALGKGQFEPGFQAAFIAETSFQMLEADLDISCYYHIRDYPFDPDAFRKFYPESDVLEQVRFWDRHPVYLGLFDYQNQVRPSYFVFRLLARLTGQRVAAVSTSDTVHAMASVDKALGVSSILIWNYSDNPTKVRLHLNDIPTESHMWRFVLDSEGPSSEETHRLQSQPMRQISAGNGDFDFPLNPWGITLVSLEQH